MLLSTLAATLALLVPAQALEADWGAQADANPTVNTTLNQAIDYSLPYVYMGRLRASRLTMDVASSTAPLNDGFAHERQLINATYRVVTTPNTDTLYSRAYLDLSAGPVNISFPEMSGRYFSMSLLDAASNAFFVGGRRTTGTLATTFIVVGPDWKDEIPVNERTVFSPTNDVYVQLRTLVDGEDDLATVNALQDQYSLKLLHESPEPVPSWDAAPPNGTSAADWVNMANLVLERNPPPQAEQYLIERFRPYGICGSECSWDKLSADVQGHWTARLPDVITAMRTRKIGTPINGWNYVIGLIGNFGTAYDTRAQTAVSGLLALPVEEAMYPYTHTDAQGEFLMGTNKYHIPLPAGVPQVNAFWSLTLYEILPDGSLYFADNEINRYNIGDRTAGLLKNEDGSIDLYIQSEPPTDEAQRDNWLPAPKGRFSLFFRAYEPGADFRDLRQPLPAIVKA